MSQDLSLVPSDDLIEALRVRFDYFVFSGLRVGVKFNGDTVTIRRWWGNSTTCVGLATELATAIILQKLEESEDIDKGEAM